MVGRISHLDRQGIAKKGQKQTPREKVHEQDRTKVIFLECFLTLLTISCSSPSTQRKPVLFCLSFFMSDILHLSTTTNQCDKVQLTLICQPCYNNQDKQSARSCRGLCKGYFCPLPQKRKLQQLLYIHRDVDTYNKQMMICKAAALCCMS